MRLATLRPGLRALLALALCALPTSAAGQAVPPGQLLEPSATRAVPATERVGMTHLQEVRRRTPSGLLHPFPPSPRQGVDLGRGLSLSAETSFGFLGDIGDESEAAFEAYTDWDDGAFLQDVHLRLDHAPSGLGARLDAGALGREDQWLRAALSWPGHLGLELRSDRLLRTLATDVQSLLRGAGTDSLTLPDGLVPGGNPVSALDDALPDSAGGRLSFQRDRMGAHATWSPTPAWTLEARFDRDEKRGRRASGGALVFGFQDPGIGSVVELVEPLDHRTDRASTRLEYARPGLQASLAWQGSWFRNEHRSLTWENPFAALGGAAPQLERGRLALDPENDWHQVRGSFAATLPGHLRLTATLAWSRSEQDERLLAPTVNSGTILFGALDLDDWNTPAALSRRTARAEVRTWLADVRLRFEPHPRISLELRARGEDLDNRTRYRAENPLTGELGYPVEDGGLAAATFSFSGVYDPNDPGVDRRYRFRNTPFGGQRREYAARLRLRLPARTSAGLTIDRDERRPDHRERSRLWEDSVRLDLASRAFRRVTLRGSWRTSRRSGTTYDAFVQEEFFTSSLPGFVASAGGTPPSQLAQLRRSDLADRTVQRGEVRLHWLLSDSVDLGFSAHLHDEDLRAAFGLETERRVGGNAELSFQPTPALHGFLYGSFERGTWTTQGIADVPGAGSDPNVGGALFPLEGSHRLRSEEDAASAGAGLSYSPHPRAALRVDYTFVRVRDRIETFLGPAALPAGISAAEARERLPDLVTSEHVVQTEVRVHLTKRLDLRFLHRWQRNEISDFRQTGLSARLGQRLFLGHADGDFAAHVLGAFVDLRL